MTTLLIFILACYGTSNILAFGSIFGGFRNLLSKMGTGPYSLHKLFTCMMCLPTWVGFGFSAIFQLYGGDTPSTIIGIDDLTLSVFTDGIIASGGVYVLNVMVEYLEGE